MHGDLHTSGSALHLDAASQQSGISPAVKVGATNSSPATRIAVSWNIQLTLRSSMLPAWGMGCTRPDVHRPSSACKVQGIRPATG